jgi:hypothetical protein
MPFSMGISISLSGSLPGVFDPDDELRVVGEVRDHDHLAAVDVTDEVVEPIPDGIAGIGYSPSRAIWDMCSLAGAGHAGLPYLRSSALALRQHRCADVV